MRARRELAEAVNKYPLTNFWGDATLFQDRATCILALWCGNLSSVEHRPDYRNAMSK